MGAVAADGPFRGGATLSTVLACGWGLELQAAADAAVGALGPGGAGGLAGGRGRGGRLRSWGGGAQGVGAESAIAALRGGAVG
jgi:hypothetical protein